MELMERLPNVYGEENLRMDGIADNVKRGANFLGLYVRKWGIASYWGKSVVRGKSHLLPFWHSPDVSCYNLRYTHTHTRKAYLLSNLQR